MGAVVSLPSSFGAANTTGPDRFSAKSMVESVRFKELDRNETYYACTQHDWKKWDFDGRVITINVTQPMLGTEKSAYFIPLRQRRPAAPYRIGKSVVDAFTALLLGEDRWPKIICPGDPEGQEFREALSKACDLPLKMLMGRNVGGSVGTVGFSWCFRNGKPVVDVHNGKHLLVREWRDRQKLVPAHVTECYQYPQDEYDAVRQKYVRQIYWHRKDWTLNTEIAFKPILVKPGKEPEWKDLIDEENSTEHGDDDCHFIWCQNVPTTNVDGLPDYHGGYDQMDSLDVLCSVIYRATTLNLDPTVVLKMDPDIVQRMGIKKGSDNALVVGEEGDASYMEITGAGIEAGIKAFVMERKKFLEQAQCVLPDPEEIAASGQSSLAQKVVYRPMLAQGSVHRTQYGNAIKQLLDSMTAVARKRLDEVVDIIDDNGLVTGKQTYYINLPKKVEETEVVEDETGVGTGEKTTEMVELEPGEAEECDLEWGEWFPPTSADKEQLATTLTAATGGKPFLSPQSATEEAAIVFGRDPAEEWKRMQAAQKADDVKEQKQIDAQNDALGAMPGAGGKPGFGAKPKPPGGGGGAPPGGGAPAKPKAPKPFGGNPFGGSDKG